MKETVKILITVKTYPTPSQKYEELVCTAGVTEEGDFIRLYPINFRDLPYDRQYKKYQWIEVKVRKRDDDVRKESYQPDCDTLKVVGEIKSWSERAHYVLAKEASSLEELKARWEQDYTSLGIFKPKEVKDIVFTTVDPDWNPKIKAKLQQLKLIESGRTPLRKLPYDFQYVFQCDDERCKEHRLKITDWELGALFWRLVDNGLSLSEAAQKVKDKFLNDLCGPQRYTYFYVGNIKQYPQNWLVIGLFAPLKKDLSFRQLDWA